MTFTRNQILKALPVTPKRARRQRCPSCSEPEFRRVAEGGLLAASNCEACDHFELHRRDRNDSTR